MQKEYFGYIRVSTAKQGEQGVSLQEQRAAIEQYGRRYSLTIREWFEERESAAKRGRPVFAQMLRLLRQGKAHGLIIHKIDRSARNLKDWADLGELIDSGIEVLFANESLDLHTRGGRLSADIQAVVAADYIRNLREETRKGFYGRLKQGFYPLPAPIGYLDRGKAKVKDLDPETAPLIAKAFELYGTSRYSLPRLREELERMMLRNRRGGVLTLTGLSTVLHNPFYAGLIRIKITGELFPGNHNALVTKSLFDRVQLILAGKRVPRAVRHDFTFRRLARCGHCTYALIGELQKGHVYYRCHSTDCPTTSVREEHLETVVSKMLSDLRFDEQELRYIRSWVENARLNEDVSREQEIQSHKLRLDGTRGRLNRLTDAFLDGVVEKALFEERRQALLSEEKDVEQRLQQLEAGDSRLRRLERFLELVKNAVFTYQNAIPAEKRELIANLTSNLTVSGKNVNLEPKPAVQLLVQRAKDSYGAPYRGVPRTLDRLLKQLLAQFDEQILPETPDAQPPMEPLAAAA